MAAAACPSNDPSAVAAAARTSGLLVLQRIDQRRDRRRAFLVNDPEIRRRHDADAWLGVGEASSSSGTTAFESSGARSLSLPSDRSASCRTTGSSLRARFPKGRECLAAHEAERHGRFRCELRVGQVLGDVSHGGGGERAEDAAGLERRLLQRDV